MSSQVLGLLHPAGLAENSPWRVLGDGNCMYRALSLALFGTKDYHVHIRLATVLEIYQHRQYYDTAHPDYIDLLKDDRMDRCNYRQLLRTTIKDGAYAGMQHMLAASGALQCGISSYYPPTVVNSYLVCAYTRPIFGRGVKSSKGTMCTLMWTQASVPSSPREFRANHFAVLAPRQRAPVPVIHVNESLCVPSYAEAVKRTSPLKVTMLLI